MYIYIHMYKYTYIHVNRYMHRQICVWMTCILTSPSSALDPFTVPLETEGTVQVETGAYQKWVFTSKMQGFATGRHYLWVCPKLKALCPFDHFITGSSFYHRVPCFSMWPPIRRKSLESSCGPSQSIPCVPGANRWAVGNPQCYTCQLREAPRILVSIYPGKKQKQWLIFCTCPLSPNFHMIISYHFILKTPAPNCRPGMSRKGRTPKLELVTS